MEAAANLRKPVRVLIVDEAKQAGAAGYVTTDRIAAKLVGAILEVAST